jgi:hypothetical protein
LATLDVLLRLVTTDLSLDQIAPGKARASRRASEHAGAVDRPISPSMETASATAEHNEVS